MQNYGKWIGASAIALATLTTVAGCTDKNNNGQPDSAASPAQVDQTVGNMANAAANTAKEVGNTVSNAATTATNAVAGAASNATKAVEGAADAAVNTPKIKTALLNNPSLAGANIDVDTNGEKNTINLKGSVKNAAQKTLAAKIAQQTAGAQYKVNNQLTVAGGKMSGGKMGGANANKMSGANKKS